VGIADRAGYPVLTVPAGFASENSINGRRPDRVSTSSTPHTASRSSWTTAMAFEQGTHVRQDGPAYMLSTTIPNAMFSGAPSETNQSMWRCVPGSSFFKPYDCNPGEVGSGLTGE